MKKNQVIILAFVAGGITAYALMRMGVFSGQVKLGYTAPRHDWGPVPSGGIPTHGFIPATTITAPAKVF